MAEPYDFRDSLDKPLSDFPEMPNLPGGKTFYGKLVGISAGISSQRKTPFYRFDARLTDPGSDVKPTDLEAITTAGFSLADYEVFSEFYLTPGAIRHGQFGLRKFLETLGFSGSTTFREALKLDVDGVPTEESQEALRGLDIVCRTQAADDQARVFNRLEMMAGTGDPGLKAKK